MKSVSLALAAVAAFVVSTTACGGLKDAMTAHVDTAARAGSEELSVDRLAALLNEATVPPRKEVASTIANTWIDYQLLAQAAAKGDTAVSTKQIDDAMWASIGAMKARKYYETVSKNWGTVDSVAARRMYNSGDVLAASHILLVTKGVPEADKAAARTKAAALRAQANASNFAQLAKANSQDPPSAARGGSLGLFRRGQMVPQFEQALVALKPGEISPVIETEYGYHIIRRPTYDEVRDQLLQASKGRSMQQAESTFVANIQSKGNIALKSDAATTARKVIADPDAHKGDGNVLATSTAGKFTAGELARWIGSFAPQALAQQQAQLQTAPDSVVTMLVKTFVTNDLVVQAADNAKLGPTPTEMQQMYTGFTHARDAAWTALGIDPKSLADTAKSTAERVRVANARITKYMDQLVTGQAQYVQVPEPVSHVLREKMDASLNAAGIDRAVERAVKQHVSTDSARNAAQPPTAVPMPTGGAQSPAAPATGATVPPNTRTP
ncbi:MAG: peptidylprolyl isomerase [Gemmatimonadaceae bacterium]